VNYLQTVILSLVEGITEFLPISSTGHLILTGQLLGLLPTEFVKSFEIAIQLGAILAVVVLYFHRLLINTKLWWKLILAFLPTGLIGFLVYPLVKSSFLGNSTLVVWSLFLGGIVILIWEKFFDHSDPKTNSLAEISPAQAIIIGAVQSLSVIPGVSRALATIFGGLAVGLNKKTATEFSFLLAIPTMLAATGYDLIKTGFLFGPQEYSMLSVGFVVAFLSALTTVKWLIGFVQTHSFRLFAFYRIALAIVFWLVYIK